MKWFFLNIVFGNLKMDEKVDENSVIFGALFFSGPIFWAPSDGFVTSLVVFGLSCSFIMTPEAEAAAE